MRGLDPRIHDEATQASTLRLFVAASHHGLPGQARQ